MTEIAIKLLEILKEIYQNNIKAIDNAIKELKELDKKH